LGIHARDQKPLAYTFFEQRHRYIQALAPAGQGDNTVNPVKVTRRSRQMTRKGDKSGHIGHNDQQYEPLEQAISPPMTGTKHNALAGAWGKAPGGCPASKPLR
jgi:hypothetical protein